MKTKPSFLTLSTSLKSLQRAIAQPKNEFNRDSVIQRFEFTLELAWKTMKKFLEYGGLDSPTIPKDIIRSAAQAGWIQEPKLWIEFIDGRNKSSHTYHEEIAEEVYTIALRLPKEVETLVLTLNKIT